MSDGNIQNSLRINDYTEKEISQDFDYFNQEYVETGISIMAYKSYDTSTIANVNLGEAKNVRISYSVEFNQVEDQMYIAMSTFDENENLIKVEMYDAYPIYYEDGAFDAQVYMNDKTVLLSELNAGEHSDCSFALAIAGTAWLAKLIAGAIIAAKVTVVVGGTVVGGIIVGKAIETAVKSGWFTYKLNNLTKAKVESRTKTATRQKGNNRDVYFLAELHENKVCINSSPWTKNTAIDKIKKYGHSFWTPIKSDAKELAVAVSGGYAGPEIHADKDTGIYDGRYYHYHPLNHKTYKGRSIHIWYGFSYGDIY